MQGERYKSALSFLPVLKNQYLGPRKIPQLFASQNGSSVLHDIEIPQEIIDRVLTRRARYHLFDHFKPSETALVVIDMQPTFVAPDSPAEVPASRGIIANINALAADLRENGALICWVTQ